jgi:bacteriocin leader peptide (microcyclamide/patellamide family)
MDKQNLMPQAAQPVNRSTTGQLPDVLAELSEEALQLHGDSANVEAAAANEAAAVLASFSSSSDILQENPGYCHICSCLCFLCSYDGDDAE